MVGWKLKVSFRSGAEKREEGRCTNMYLYANDIHVRYI